MCNEYEDQFRAFHKANPRVYEAIVAKTELLEQEKQGLASERDTLAAQLSSAQQSGANLDDLRGRVDGILSKFELLDL